MMDPPYSNTAPSAEFIAHGSALAPKPGGPPPSTPTRMSAVRKAALRWGSAGVLKGGKHAD